MGSDATPTRRYPDPRGPLARRPAVLAAAMFIGGIFLHTALPAWPFVWMTLVVLSGIAAIVWFRRGVVSSVCIAIALLLCGLLVAQREAFFYAADHIGSFASERPRLAQLELQIDNEPRILSDPFSTRPMPPKQVVTARVVRVMTWSGWVNTSGDILVQIAQPHPRVALNQRVRVLGMLERPAPAMNPGQFDWASYYRDQRILTSVHVPNASNIHILEEHGAGPLDFVRAQSRRLLALGFKSERSLDHALLRALLLGDSDPELRDVQEQFKRTGTSHHLAISGMHIAVLGAVVLFMARAMRLRPRAAVLVMLVFVVIYGIAALPSPPVVRSIVLCLFFGIGIASRRSTDAIQLLALSVFAMLLYKPLDLYNAGFQLSFGTVLGLMLFARPLHEWIEWLRTDPLVVRVPQNMTPMQRLSWWAETSLSGAFAAATIAWLVSMPLIAFHFEQVNLWAIPASIILAPIVFVALIGGMLKVLLTLLLPSFAGTWATMAAAPMAFMRTVLSWLNLLPRADWPFPGLTLLALVIIYAFYLLWLVKLPVPKLRLCARLAPVCVLGVTLAMPLHAMQRRMTAAPELRLTLLAVGAGQAAVLETPSGKTILIDAGSLSLSDPLRKCLGPFLRTRGCTQVETMILTHSDLDHVNAAAQVAQVYDVREVLIGGRFRALAQDNPTAESLLRSLEALDATPRVVAPGQHLPLARDVELEVLWPPPNGDPITSNDSAIVAKVHYREHTILITGDIQEVAQRALLQNPEQLKADVLIAPHHGSSESTTEDFVAAVDPQFIISSNDRTLTGKQRRFERLIHKRPLFRTNECGAITVHLPESGTVWVEPFLKRKSTASR
jgi:competence protein ComEC